MEFAENGQKEYVAGLRLGQVTDTQDVTGTTLETRPVTADRAALEAPLPRFLGEQDQIPPYVLRCQGRRAETLRPGPEGTGRGTEARPHHHLRAGATGPERNGLPASAAAPKGTYIRTLCHDIGRQLGCGGTLYALRRTMAAGFRLDQAVTLEAVQAQGTALLRLRTASSQSTRPCL